MMALYCLGPLISGQQFATTEVLNCEQTIAISWNRPCFHCHLALVVRGGDVHLLLDHVVDVGRGAALDPLLLLPLQLVSHHLDGLCPLVSERPTRREKNF